MQNSVTPREISMLLLKKLYDNFEEYACALFAGVMISCLSLQLVIRITLGSSLAWTEELSRYSFLWTVYVGAALAVKRGAHVRITAQFLPMSTRWRLFFRMLADALWVIFCLFFACTGLSVIKEGFAFPEISPTLGIVISWVEAIIPFSFVLMAWRIIEQYAKKWRSGSLADLVRYEEEAQ